MIFITNASRLIHLASQIKYWPKRFIIFELIKEYGPNLGKPHTDSLSDGLFEVRAKGEEGIGRSLFCYANGKRVIILHSFVKKTQKTPKKDLDLALKRKKEIENENDK